MNLTVTPLSTAFTPILRAFRPKRDEFRRFVEGFKSYYANIDGAESEENLKTHLMDLLKSSFSPNHLIEQQERIDFVIRTGGKSSNAGVLVESKRDANQADMITVSDCNRKAMHELVLYYMRERASGNTDIQKLIICTEHQFFIFEAHEFERLFFRNHGFNQAFSDWTSGKKTDKTTEFFYSQIARPFIGENKNELRALRFDLRDFKAKLDQGVDDALIPLYKILSPQNLLKADIENDSNVLNKAFYDELLYIIGVEERKESGNRIIDRPSKEHRNPATLIENTIARLRHEDQFNEPDLILNYGTNNDERAFSIALELCLTWLDRLLFLKLLEAQIVKFHAGDVSYKFLHTGLIADFHDLSDLFFMVLALPQEERPSLIRTKYKKVPYLNSSLFEKSPLERIVGIDALNSSYELQLLEGSVLHAEGRAPPHKKNTVLRYLFAFLDAHDFGSAGDAELREENKTIINAAVLGLIFEKINGYKEGAVFTPGYITMYISSTGHRKGGNSILST